MPIRIYKRIIGVNCGRGINPGTTGKHWKLSPEVKEKVIKNLIGGGWNKGMKGLWGANSGSFKKGQIPWNKNKPHLRVRGEKHWNWQGGIYYRPSEHRKNNEYICWRLGVFGKDNFTCQKCGAISKVGKQVYLEPHHIKNWINFPELRFNTDNGITFCKNCHREFHKIYGKRNNTKEQLEEFLKTIH